MKTNNHWTTKVLLSLLLMAGVVDAKALDLTRPLPDLHVDNITETFDHRHHLTVWYPAGVDIDSLSDGDLWVVSHNGYNQRAHFVEAVRAVPEIDPTDPNIDPATGQRIGPDGTIIDVEPYGFIEATYAIPAPSDGWTTHANGRYAVLLDSNQVYWDTGDSLQPTTPLAPRWLGEFHVRIGDDDVYPLETKLRISTEQPHPFAHLALTFPSPAYQVVDWGNIRREENRLFINVSAIHDRNGAYPEVITTYEHDYRLSHLAPGGYLLTVLVNGNEAVKEDFRIEESDTIPADVHMHLSRADYGANAHVTVHFHDPYYVIADQSEPVLDGHTFVIDAKAVMADFFVEPEGPGIAELEYRLPVEERGEYAVVFRLNGVPFARDSFTHPGDGNQIPAEVAMRLAPADFGAFAHVKVHFLDPYFVITERPAPVLDGDTFVINVRAEEVVFVRPPDEPAITELDYELKVEDAGAYKVAFHVNGVPMARDAFRYPWIDVPPDLPYATIEVAQGDASWFANVNVELAPGTFIAQWGELTRVNGGFTVDLMIETWPEDWAEGDVSFAPPAPEPTHMTFNLGVLDPGAYSFGVTSGDKVLGRQGFRVPRIGEPPFIHAFLEAASIHRAGGETHEFTVVYHSEHGIDPDTLGDDDILVKSWTRFIDVDPLPFWAEQVATLVEAEVRDDGMIAKAVYSINAPEGGWSAEHNGEFEVCLLPETVGTSDGLNPEEMPLGGFAVRIEPEPDFRIHAVLKARSITESGEEPHKFHVVYESNTPIDLDSINGDEIEVTSWVILADFIGFPPLWAHQVAELIEFESNDAQTRIEAVYAIAPPEGGWTHEMNGTLSVHLAGDSVASVNGDTARARRLGTIAIEIDPFDDVPEWLRHVMSTIRIESADDLTTTFGVELDFRDTGYRIDIADWGELTVEENHVIADVTVERSEIDDETPTPGAPPVFHNTWTLENLAPGHHRFILRIIGHTINGEYFFVHGDTPFVIWLEDHLGRAADAEAAPSIPVRNVRDADGDGQSDYVEWALGLNPVDPESRRGIEARIVSRGGRPHHALVFRKALDLGEDMISIDASGDLNGWQEIDLANAETDSSLVDARTEERTVILGPTDDSTVAQFYRIRVRQ